MTKTFEGHVFLVKKKNVHQLLAVVLTPDTNYVRTNFNNRDDVLMKWQYFLLTITASVMKKLTVKFISVLIYQNRLHCLL